MAEHSWLWDSHELGSESNSDLGAFGNKEYVYFSGTGVLSSSGQFVSKSLQRPDGEGPVT